jgi:hypothetical protein
MFSMLCACAVRLKLDSANAPGLPVNARGTRPPMAAAAFAGSPRRLAAPHPQNRETNRVKISEGGSKIIERNFELGNSDFSRMSLRAPRQNAAARLIADFARVTNGPMACLDAANLLNQAEALGASAPRIEALARSTTADTIKAVPFLMRGRFRVWRLRLLRQYLESIREDAQIKLSARADELALSGQWGRYFGHKLLLWRFDLHIARLNLLGALFVLHFPVKFERSCERLMRLVGR